MQASTKAHLKDVAKSPWIGVLLALIGVVNARLDLEKQKQANVELEIKARLLAKTSDSMGAAVEDNSQILLAENRRLRVLMSALAAYSAANGKKLDDALGVSSDAVVLLPAGITELDTLPDSGQVGVPDGVAKDVPEVNPGALRVGAPGSSVPDAGTTDAGVVSAPDAGGAKTAGQPTKRAVSDGQVKPAVVEKPPEAKVVPASAAEVQKTLERIANESSRPALKFRQVPKLMQASVDSPNRPEPVNKQVKF